MSLQIFATGHPSPFGPLPEGPTLMISPAGLRLVLSLVQPTPEEVEAIRRGRLWVGLTQPAAPGAAALLVWRFRSRRPGIDSLTFDTPFHMGANPSDRRHLPPRAPHQYRILTIHLQDEHGICRNGGRVTTLSPDFCGCLEAVVDAQVRAAGRPGWNYDRAIDEALIRWPTLAAALEGTFISEFAGVPDPNGPAGTNSGWLI